MRINRIGNWAKTTVLASLLAATPLTAKAQHLHSGEQILGRDTVNLFYGKTAQILGINSDGTAQYIDRLALYMQNKGPTGRGMNKKYLNGDEGYFIHDLTQYADSLVRVYERTEGNANITVSYYIVGPQVRRDAIYKKGTDEFVTNIVDSSIPSYNGVQEFPHRRQEITKELYEWFKKFMPKEVVKDENVVVEGMLY